MYKESFKERVDFGTDKLVRKDDFAIKRDIEKWVSRWVIFDSWNTISFIHDFMEKQYCVKVLVRNGLFRWNG